MLETGDWGTILEFIGTMMIGLAVLKVHARVGRDHRIDAPVIHLIMREQKMTVVGMTLIAIGFVLHLL